MRRSDIQVWCSVGVLLMLCAAAVTAQTGAPDRSKITTAEILSRSIDAAGGLASLKNLKTLEVHGRLMTSSLSTYSQHDFAYYRREDSDLFELESAGRGTVFVGQYKGNALHNRIGGFGFGMVNNVSVGVMIEMFRTLGEWNWAARFRKISMIGVEAIDGKNTYAIGFEPGKGDRQIRYYDSRTFSLLRLDQAQRFRATEHGEQQAYEVEAYLSDYKADVLTLPHRVHFVARGFDVDLTVDKYVLNGPIDESLFRKKLDAK